MFAYEMACQLLQKCPLFARLPIFMQENWTQSVHNIQFLYFIVKIKTSHRHLIELRKCVRHILTLMEVSGELHD